MRYPGGYCVLSDDFLEKLSNAIKNKGGTISSPETIEQIKSGKPCIGIVQLIAPDGEHFIPYVLTITGPATYFKIGYEVTIIAGYPKDPNSSELVVVM